MNATIEQLPKNEDAERALVGLAFLDQMIPVEARDLKAADFSNQFLRSAWAAMFELEADGLEIHPITVVERMRRNGMRYGIAELTATTNGVLRNPAMLAGQVREASVKRQVMRRLYDSIADIGSGKLAVSEIKARVGEIEAVGAPLGKFRRLDEIIEREVRPALQELREGRTSKIPTGFGRLDSLIGGGLSPSDVMVVAALTGIGKSAFVLQMAASIAAQMVPVAFLSGEMTDRENGLRLLTQAARVYNLNSETKIHESQFYFLSEWADALKDLPIWFDSTTFDLVTLRRHLSRLVETAGIRVLFIDYLQLFRAGRGTERSRTERIAEASQEVRRIALEFGVAVVEVVQFNREGAKGGRPGLHDLEGSSQLEKDASIVLVIDRDAATGARGGAVSVRIVKGRNAALSEFSGTYDGPSLRFDFEEEHHGATGV